MLTLHQIRDMQSLQSRPHQSGHMRSSNATQLRVPDPSHAFPNRASTYRRHSTTVDSITARSRIHGPRSSPLAGPAIRCDAAGDRTGSSSITSYPPSRIVSMTDVTARDKSMPILPRPRSYAGYSPTNADASAVQLEIHEIERPPAAPTSASPPISPSPQPSSSTMPAPSSFAMLPSSSLQVSPQTSSTPSPSLSPNSSLSPPGEDSSSTLSRSYASSSSPASPYLPEMPHTRPLSWPPKEPGTMSRTSSDSLECAKCDSAGDLLHNYPSQAQDVSVDIAQDGRNNFIRRTAVSFFTRGPLKWPKAKKGTLDGDTRLSEETLEAVVPVLDKDAGAGVKATSATKRIKIDKLWRRVRT
ncbi:hypothetical protein PLICRDRAFT_43710 [Plicaturopsis crispa FD-325 SS-3]|nr:hypothetical protein PLICRDRAFT_43710 [Plicaturopsis crispa FD-325 SS-3]